MKYRKSLLLLFFFASSLVLTGCADTKTEAEAATATPKAALDVDHHAGEENVMPHGHDNDAEPHDDSGQPPHGHSEVMEDHHAGEENVEPHGHDGGIEPHDDSGQPPHRH